MDISFKINLTCYGQLYMHEKVSDVSVDVQKKIRVADVDNIKCLKR